MIKLSKLWENAKQKKPESEHEQTFLPKLIEEFFVVLDSLKKNEGFKIRILNTLIRNERRTFIEN